MLLFVVKIYTAPHWILALIRLCSRLCCVAGMLSIESVSDSLYSLVFSPGIVILKFWSRLSVGIVRSLLRLGISRMDFS